MPKRRRVRPRVSGKEPGYPGALDPNASDDYDVDAKLVRRKQAPEIHTEIIRMEDKPRITRELPKDPYNLDGDA